MNAKSVQLELKQFGVALASMMAKLSERYSDADDLMVTIDATSNGYAKFSVTAWSGNEYRVIAGMACPDVLKKEWHDTPRYDGTVGGGDK